MLSKHLGVTNFALIIRYRPVDCANSQITDKAVLASTVSSKLHESAIKLLFSPAKSLTLSAPHTLTTEYHRSLFHTSFTYVGNIYMQPL